MRLRQKEKQDLWEIIMKTKTVEQIVFLLSIIGCLLQFGKHFRMQSREFKTLSLSSTPLSTGTKGAEADSYYKVRQCRQTCKRKLPTDGEADKQADRQRVYSPLSSWINIWSAALWWVLIRTLIHSLLIPTDCDHCLDESIHFCNLWMYNQDERLKA